MEPQEPNAPPESPAPEPAHPAVERSSAPEKNAPPSALETWLARLDPHTWTAARALRVLVGLLAMAVCADAAYGVVGPMLANMHAMGQHDWDSEASFRYITALSILKYHELPWWHPYLCGGFPAWGYGETATNLVSPYLLAHLLLATPAAIRVEIVGNTALSLFATWLFVGRFTKNAGLRVLVAIVYSVNGRMALQVASGHAWHMQYAWTPLALYFFDVSLERGKLRQACWAGAAIAMIVYAGGIYPLPHTALAVGGYAVFVAVARRSSQPLVALAITGASAVGLAAPKLLPVMEVMKRWPRAIESYEAIDLGRLYEMLANPKQTFSSGPVATPQWGWHEWGIYVGPIVVACMLLALVASRDTRFAAARGVGVVFFCLSCGAFHPYAPWTLLHKLPVFSSQHVSSRFAYVAVLMMMTAFAALVGSFIDRFDRRVPWLSLLLLLPAWWIGRDVASVGAVATQHTFFLDFPKIVPHEAFVQSHNPEFEYQPAASRAGASLLAMYRNEGFVDCDLVPNNANPKGTIAKGYPGYRGESYILDGPGSTSIVEWSPSHAVVQYSGATPGTTLMYNMNWDPGWDANGEPALETAHAVSGILPNASGKMVFKYRPRSIGPGILLFFATLLAIGFTPARRLYRRRHLG